MPCPVSKAKELDVQLSHAGKHTHAAAVVAAHYKSHATAAAAAAEQQKDPPVAVTPTQLRISRNVCAVCGASCLHKTPVIAITHHLHLTTPAG
jgi:hypothetical protein